MNSETVKLAMIIIKKKALKERESRKTKERQQNKGLQQRNQRQDR